ncbi:MAG: hypothetical protein IMW85_03530 [Thermicanus sp.]|nr:hypothetical protein [Thermicanus sp.]
MIHRSDILKMIQSGERVYLTFYDGEGSSWTLGGRILQLIEEAIIFRVRTGRDMDRMLVIYLNRIKSLEKTVGSRYVS